MIGLLAVVMFLKAWVTNYLTYTKHIMVAQIVGRIYFLGEGEQLPDHVCTKAFNFAFTKAWGSAAFAAFLLAVIEFFRSLARSMQNSRNIVVKILGCLIECILNCFESIIRYLSTYALIYVAIYGESFWNGGKRFVRMIKSVGMDAIFNYTIMNMVSFYANLVFFKINFLVFYLFLYVTQDLNLFSEDSVSAWASKHNGGGASHMIWIVSFLLLWLISQLMLIACLSITTKTIVTGVETCFVCYAEDPQALKKTDPVTYERLTTEWEKLGQEVKDEYKEN